jgi:hypothetical protein
MAHELNFAKNKKKFMTVTMPDGQKILVRTPTKKIMDSLFEMGEDFKELEKSGVTSENTEIFDRVYSACAEILSNNVGCKEITVDYLESSLDIEDTMVLFEGYVDFLNDIQAATGKN